MSLATQLTKLTDEQKLELKDAMVEAGVIKELGGNWREVFRRMKHKYRVGFKHKLYARLEQSDEACFDEGEEILIKAFG